MNGLKHGGLFESLRGVGKKASAATVSTKVSVGASRKKFLSSGVHGELVDMADKAEDYLDHLTVTGLRGEETVHVDLLTKRLDDQITIARSNSLGNAPAPEQMYASIKQARARLKRT